MIGNMCVGKVSWDSAQSEKNLQNVRSKYIRNSRLNTCMTQLAEHIESVKLFAGKEIKVFLH
jgi:hypothetical protein